VRTFQALTDVERKREGASASALLCLGTKVLVDMVGVWMSQTTHNIRAWRVPWALSLSALLSACLQVIQLAWLATYRQQQH
jgi:hypothetical protein